MTFHEAVVLMEKGHKMRRKCWHKGYIRSYGGGRFFMDENGDDYTDCLYEGIEKTDDWEEATE